MRLGVRAALLAALCCVAAASAEETGSTQRTMKSLVVYYSLTGKTQIVALALAKELGADVRRIEDVEKPSVGWWFIVTASLAAIRGAEAEIKPIDTDFKGYDRVFVGSPVWGGNPSTPLNAFFARADFTGKNVIPFMTMGGDDASGALRKMSERVEKRGGKVGGAFALSTAKASDEQLAEKTREFAKAYR